MNWTRVLSIPLGWLWMQVSAGGNTKILFDMYVWGLALLTLSIHHTRIKEILPSLGCFRLFCWIMVSYYNYQRLHRLAWYDWQEGDHYLVSMMRMLSRFQDPEEYSSVINIDGTSIGIENGCFATFGRWYIYLVYYPHSNNYEHELLLCALSCCHIYQIVPSRLSSTLALN